VKRLLSLACAALLVFAVGQALAKGGGFKLKHHTHKYSYSAFQLSATGSATWAVTENIVESNGDTYRYDESSYSQWHYGIPTENSGAAGLSVTYPLPCLEERALPCPTGGATGSGPGEATMDVKIDDSATTGLPAVTHTLKCKADVSAKIAGGGAVVGATFIKATDSYLIHPGVAPISGTLVAEAEVKCPDTPGVTKLDDWGPPELPSGGPTVANWWGTKDVTIPAVDLASSGTIDFPVSLLDKNAAPDNCGIKPPAGESFSCTARGSWSGLLTLHATH
jgi:hypothetical protein